MKSTIIFKRCKCIQLGHLYEHLICIKIENALRNASLYSLIDYTLTGKTYHGGTICIEFTQYRGRKINLIKLINNLSINFNGDNISLGLNQIVAELDRQLISTGINNIIAELINLHNCDWKSVEDLDILDLSKEKRSDKPLCISSNTLKPNKKLKIEIMLNSVFAKKNSELIPLFRQVSYLIMINAEEIINNDFGYYSSEDSIVFLNKKYCKLSNEFSTGLSKSVSDKSVQIIFNDLISSMKSDKVFNHFSVWLRKQSYSNGTQNTVNLEKNYEDTLMFVGLRGWSKVAKIDNIYQILNNISFKIY